MEMSDYLLLVVRIGIFQDVVGGVDLLQGAEHGVDGEGHNALLKLHQEVKDGVGFVDGDVARAAA